MFSYFYVVYIVDNLQYETPIYAYNENDVYYFLKEHFSDVTISSIKSYKKPHCFIVGEPSVEKNIYGYDIKSHFLSGGFIGIDIENNIFEWKLDTSISIPINCVLRASSNHTFSLVLDENKSNHLIERMILESIKIFENMQKNA